MLTKVKIRPSVSVVRDGEVVVVILVKVVKVVLFKNNKYLDYLIRTSCHNDKSTRFFIKKNLKIKLIAFFEIFFQNFENELD